MVTMYQKRCNLASFEEHIPLSSQYFCFGLCLSYPLWIGKMRRVEANLAGEETDISLINI